MKKGVKIVALAIALIMVVGTFSVSAAREAPTEEILLGGVPTYLDRFDSFLLYSRGMEEKLDDLGIDYQYVLRAPPGGFSDHEGQRAIFEDMLTIGAEMIMTLPTSIDTQHASFEMIVDEYEVPLIITDYLEYAEGLDPPENDHLVRFASYRHIDMGEAVADYVAENYPEGSRMVMIQGIPGVITHDRSNVDAHEANGMEIVYEHYADFNREMAYEATLDFLATGEDVDLILGMNSTMAMGVIRAVEDSGMMGEVDVIGFGGVIEELEAVWDGRMRATAGRNHFSIGEYMADVVVAYMEDRFDETEKTFAAPIVVYDSPESIATDLDPRYYDMFDADMKEEVEALRDDLL